MSASPPLCLEKTHRFLDEAGDTTFFGKGRLPILGQDGVSLCFGLGMVKFDTPASEVRAQVVQLCRAVATDDYLNRIPSVSKRIQSGGLFFHAKDDPPEVRERMFKWIRDTDCSLEMVVGRKIPTLFARKHHVQDSEFYADLLSHLLKNKLKLGQRLVITIAERGKTTRNHVLELAIPKEMLPDLEFCLGRKLSGSDYVECETGRARALVCKHALPFGMGFFCKHPDRLGIATRTRDRG